MLYGLYGALILKLDQDCLAPVLSCIQLLEYNIVGYVSMVTGQWETDLQHVRLLYLQSCWFPKVQAMSVNLGRSVILIVLLCLF